MNTDYGPVIRVPIRRGRFLLWAAGQSVPGLAALAFAALVIATQGLGWGMVCLGGAGLLMTLVALCQFGIALAAPIGLRMDRHGLSGFYLAPLAWRDVQNMTLYTRDAHSRVDASYDLDAPPSPADMFLALRLWDHEKWWQTNTTMQRILFLLRGRAKGWDALISIGTLALTDRHALADAACDLHDRRPPAI